MITHNAATRATWGQRAAVEPTKPKMRLLEVKPLRRNTLRGFCVVELPSGLIVRDVSIHTRGGRCWASLPAKPQIDQDGRQRCSSDGKPLYTAILEWRSRELSDRFRRLGRELRESLEPK